MRQHAIKLLPAVFTFAAFISLTAGLVAAEVPTITKEELRAKLDDSNVVIVDVRQGRDWKASNVKIKGAIREDPGDIEGWAGKYPKEKTLVLYCA